MTYSWTYAPAVYIDGTDVTSALLSYSLSGNQTSAIVSGEIVFSKRALDAILTPVTGMSVIISRVYQVTEDGVTTTTDITIFRGHVTAPTSDGRRTTVQVQDRLRLLLNAEVNKIYGTDEQPVDIGEMAYDIIHSVGLSTNYRTGTAAIQPSGVKTKGMTFAHTNAFEALKQLATSVDYQFYYDPRDDYVYFEPKGTRTTDAQSYAAGDYTGKPKWQKDVSDMYNKVGITTGEEITFRTIQYTQASVVDTSTGAFITITVPVEAKYIAAFSATDDRRLVLSNQYSSSGPARSMDSDYSYQAGIDGKTNIYIFQDTGQGTDAYYDYPANTVFTIQYYYNSSTTIYFTDSNSIATYGEITKTISRPDLRVRDDLGAVAAAYLSAHANPTESVTVDLVQDPKKFCFLGGVVDLDDPINGRNEEGMTVIGFTLNYPKKKDQFTFGEHQRVMADYTTELEHRIQQMEGNFANKDYSQTQYVPIGRFVEEPDPDTTWTVTPSVATVLASATTTTNAVGNPMQWKTGYASGRHWVFWGDGTNDVYSQSVNGVVGWAAKTTLNAGAGNDLSMDFSDSGFQLVRGYDVADLKYRRGVVSSTGTVTLNSEVSAQAGGSTNRVHHFSWDTNMNAVYSYMRDGSIYVNRMLKPAGGYDGTWTSNSSIFPMQVVSDSSMFSHVARMSGSKFAVIYGKAGDKVKMRVFDGTTLQAEEECSLGNLSYNTCICTAHDNSDQIWMVYTKNTGSDYRIMYRHRAADGTWDASEQDVVGSAVYSTSTAWIGLGWDGKLYVVWFNYPSTNHIYYRPITKSGTMGDIVDAYTDSDTIASISRANMMPVARRVSTDPEVAVMDMAYLAGSSSPYKLKLFKLTFSDGPPPAEDDEEPATTGTSPIGENYDYICYPDGTASQKGGTLVNRGTAMQAIQWCIDNCPAGGKILLAPGTYTISGQMSLKNNSIYGSVEYQTATIWKGSSLIFQSTNDVPVPTSRLVAAWNDGSGGSGTGAQYIFRRDSGYTDAITVGYLELDGGMDYNANNSRAVYGGIGNYRARNTIIDHCYIHDFCKAGIYSADSATPTGTTYNVKVLNTEIANIGMRWTSGTTRWWGNGIALGGGGYSTGGSRVYVENCYIHDCTMHAVDHEPGKDSYIVDTFLDCSTMYTDTGSNSKAPWTVGYLAWSGKSSTGNTLRHCYVRSETGWTCVYNGSTTVNNTATYNTFKYHSGGAGCVASGDASLANQTISNNSETAI